MIFGQRLKLLRKNNCYTQQKLADKLSISRTSIGKYENSTAYPDFETLIEISRIFNTTTDYLLGLNNNSKNYSDEELILIDDIIKLLKKEQVISINTQMTKEIYIQIKEELETAFLMLKLFKRINKPNNL